MHLYAIYFLAFSSLAAGHNQDLASNPIQAIEGLWRSNFGNVLCALQRRSCSSGVPVPKQLIPYSETLDKYSPQAFSDFNLGATWPLKHCSLGHSLDVSAYEAVAICGASCSCAGGSSGGKPFSLSEHASSVSKIEGWSHGPSITTYGGVQALRVHFSNGVSQTVGTIPKGKAKPSTSIEFEEDEYVSGSISVGSSWSFWGLYRHVAFIQFKTSTGKQFMVGQEDRWKGIDFHADGRILTGLIGRASWSIYQVGFKLGKVVDSTILHSPVYPSLPKYHQGADQKQISTKSFINNHHKKCEKYDVKQAVQHGERYSWRVSVEFPMIRSTTFTVHGGFPVVLQSSGHTEWSVGQRGEFAASGNNIHEVVEKISVTGPPRSKVEVRLYQNVSTCSVPFTGTMKYTFTDGSSWSTQVHGKYTGASFSTIQVCFQVSKVKHHKKKHHHHHHHHHHLHHKHLPLESKKI